MMELIMLCAICLAITSLFYYHKYRTERKERIQMRAELEKQNHYVATLDSELLTTEQIIDKLEDLVFEHVSTIEEKEMAAFDISSTQALIRWVGTRQQMEVARLTLDNE